jgi:hypothetical protein
VLHYNESSYCHHLCLSSGCGKASTFHCNTSFFGKYFYVSGQNTPLHTENSKRTLDALPSSRKTLIKWSRCGVRTPRRYGLIKYSLRGHASSPVIMLDNFTLVPGRSWSGGTLNSFFASNSNNLDPAKVPRHSVSPLLPPQLQLQRMRKAGTTTSIRVTSFRK